MIALALSSFVALYMFIVCGCLATRIARVPADLTQKALLGLVVTNTLVTLVSLFFPISTTTTCALLAGSLPLLYFVRDDLKALFLSAAQHKRAICFSLPFIAFAFFVVLGPPRPYDTGLYHLQTIKWIQEYAVVPGLANLHGRFGFNPNVFTLSAFTSLADVFGQEIFSVNFTFYVILVLHFVTKICDLFKRQGFSNVLLFNLVIFLDILFSVGNLSSPSPNFISVALSFYIFSSMFPSPDPSERLGFRAYVPVLILCVYVLTVKLSTLPILLLAGFIIVKHRPPLRSLAGLSAVAAMILLPWLARNVVLTGWILYPFPSLDLFSFDWKVPISSVVLEKMAVTGWARNPGNEYLVAAKMHLAQWFPIWWHRIFLEHKILFAASVIAPSISIAGRIARKVEWDYPTLAVTVTSLCGVVFWLMMAPAMLFGQHFIVVSALSPLLWVKKSLGGWKPHPRLIPSLYGIVVVLCGFHAVKIARLDIRQVAIKPQPIQKPQDLAFQTYRTSGTVISFPTSGDRCYDQPIPCAVAPDPALLLRGRSLQSGFRHMTVE